MKIRSITASFTSWGDSDKKSWGKDIHLAMTAGPDEDPWTLEEAEVEYMRLCSRLSTLNYATLLARGMIDMDSYLERNKKVSSNFDLLIEGLISKHNGKDKDDK